MGGDRPPPLDHPHLFHKQQQQYPVAAIRPRMHLGATLSIETKKPENQKTVFMVFWFSGFLVSHISG